jgi:7-cyano-7-deazaguanine synthase
MTRRVLCLSGGLDSSVTAAMLAGEGELHPLFIDYGQAPLEEEFAAASEVTQILGLKQLSVKRAELELCRNADSSVLSPFFIAHRNLAFLALAENYAASVNAEIISFGFVADTDPHAFPDATDSFVKSANAFFDATYRGCAQWAKVEAPNIKLFKRDLIRCAVKLGFNCQSTYSCYRGGGRCGNCPSCVAVISAFEDAPKNQPSAIASAINRMNPYASLHQFETGK